MKKIAIIGRGTAGCLSITQALRWTDCNIDLYYDPAIPQQTVGEGSQLQLPIALFNNFEFTHDDLEHVDGSFKTGIEKSGWGPGHNWVHQFAPPAVAYHFNAVKLQEFILNKAKQDSRFKIIENYAEHDAIDADYILDCSGKPKNLDEFNVAEAIPVNSVYVTQCPWDYVRFNRTLTIARKHGWVFGIPLKNRCSIGYMYNNTTSTLEEIKEDVNSVFEEYNLTPSDKTNSFSFNNYYRKTNFTDRVTYNGNASFFLEPLEATSISLMDRIMNQSLWMWDNRINKDDINQSYLTEVNEIETMIAMHYYAGSTFKSKFWDMAQEKGTRKIESAIKDPRLQKFISASKNYKFGDSWNDGSYGTWWIQSWKENLINLNLYEKLGGLV